MAQSTSSIDTTAMVSPVDTLYGPADHAAVVAALAQKGTIRGAELITVSPQRKSAAAAEQTASVTPQKNDRTQGNEKKMKVGLKNWLTNNNASKKLEEVQFLGMKPKLMSKAAVAAKKAARKSNPAAKTTAASGKTKNLIC